MKYLSIFLLFFIASQSLAEKVSYERFSVYRLTPQNEEQLRQLRSFRDSLEDSAEISFWREPSVVGAAVDVLASPNSVFHLERISSLNGIDMRVMINDVQQLIDGEGLRPESRAASGGLDWKNYYTFDEINAWLISLSETYPDKVTLINAGTTYEQRTILGVRVSFNDNNRNNSVFIEGNIHAREWITSAVATFILNELLTSNDSNVRALAESHDWYIVPIFNPDGFVYTHTKDRMWRKTRVPYGKNCFGADPNRNWGFHFADGGSSNDPCSDTYHGPAAFSEPSTKSLSQYISTISGDLVAYIGLHSYSQLLLIPYGHSYEHLDNYDDLLSVGKKSIASLAQRYGTKYQVGNIPELLYIASGGSADWVKGTYKTKITYTYELRDTGRYGFVLPADQIIPTGLETLDSLVTMFKEFENL